MPVSEKPKPSSKRDPGAKRITDPRFRNIQSDPRYRLPSRKHQRVQLDDRFSRVLKDDDFSKKASVDRYGRKLPKSAGKKDLERFYRLDRNTEPDEEESGDDDEEVERELARVSQQKKNYDPAREGGFSESSSSEEDTSDEEEDEDGSEVELVELDETSAPGRAAEKEEIEEGEVSKRLAMVNLDWDHIRAVDLLAVASSFCPAGGRILKVTVFPSEFGREQMEKEELEGPPRDLFASTKAEEGEQSEGEDEDSEDEDEKIKQRLIAEQTDDNTEVNSHALRAYQLSRLRYYYAVLEADSNDTALAIYNDMDGREYLTTSNFFDLRFIPDEVSFKTDKPRDESTSVPSGYKPVDFVTEALTHSKVRLTWDEDDKGMKEAQRRAFSQRDMDENDLQAYIGSDSDSDSAADEDTVAAASSIPEQTSKLSKAEAQRAKLRAALGLPSESLGSKKKSETKDKPTGGMQVTFTAGLSSKPDKKSGSVFENTPEDVREESTREKYIRKEKERKARRKAKSKTTQPDIATDSDSADDNDNDKETMIPVADSASVSASSDDDILNNDEAGDGEDDPFNDPFFNDPTAANAAARKAAKATRIAEKRAAEAATAAQKKREREELELLMADENDGNGDMAAGGAGFDIAEIKRAEKQAKRKKGRSNKGRGADGESSATTAAAGNGQDGFEMDVADARFSGVFNSHEFAIDPSDARFSGTKGMQKLLEEGRRKRKDREGDREDKVGRTKAVVMPEQDDGIDKLLAKVKRRK